MVDVLKRLPPAVEIRRQLGRNLKEARVLRAAIRLAEKAERLREAEQSTGREVRS